MIGGRDACIFENSDLVRKQKPITRIPVLKSQILQWFNFILTLRIRYSEPPPPSNVKVFNFMICISSGNQTILKLTNFILITFDQNAKAAGSHNKILCVVLPDRR